MKHKILILLLLSASSIVLISALFALAKLGLPTHANGFTRHFPPQVLRAVKGRDLKFYNYYLAGSANGRIYLANSAATAHVLSLDEMLEDTQHIEITVKTNIDLAWQGIKIGVDHDRLNVFDRINSLYVDCFLNGDQSYKYKLPADGAIHLVPISAHSYFFTHYDQKEKKTVLSKVNFSDTVKSIRFSLDRQQDGLFSSDGILIKNQNHQLFYVYRYRNLFLRLDTQLNTALIGHTIDTNKIAKVSVKEIASTGTTTFDAPATVVNRLACADQNHLYICSGIKAANEEPRSHQENAVVDVYSALEGTYKFSFYIPYIKGQALTGLLVRDKMIVALYENYLYVFRFNDPDQK